MVSPWEQALVSVVVAVGAIVFAVRAMRSAPASASSESPPGRGARVLGLTLLALMATAPLTLFLAHAAADVPLPVKPPGPSTGCSSGSSHGDGLLLVSVVVGGLLVTRGIPTLILGLIFRRQSRGLPEVGRLLRITGSLAGVVVALVIVRFVLGGVPPKAFTTYGALTPPDAKGWRADEVLRRARGGRPSYPLGTAPAIETDARRIHTHMALSPGPHEVPGLKAWIGGQPVNLIAKPPGHIAQQRVIRRSPSIGPARRPQFASAPRYVPLGTRSEPVEPFLLYERQRDGTVFAVKVQSLGENVHAVSVKRAEVGLLLQPPGPPFLLAVLVVSFALLLIFFTRAPKQTAPPGAVTSSQRLVMRIGAAWLLLESAMWLYGSYRLYF